MSENYKIVETDVLVVGAGGAGGRATIEAGRNNVNVILVEKGFVGKSGTTATAGSRALRPKQVQDRGNIEDRFKFMLGAGCYLNDQDILWATVKECPEHWAELENFAKNMNAGPMENWNNALRYEIAKYSNIRILENTIITKLLISHGKIVGATALDIRSGEFILFKAKAVILATGGYGDLYRPSECAPLGINGGVWGDGQALAYNAGAKLVEMEMTCQQTLPDNPKWNKWYRHLIGFSSLGPFCDQDGKVISGLSLEDTEAMPIGCAPPHHGHYYKPKIELAIYIESLKKPIYVNSPKLAQELVSKGRTPSIPEKTMHIDTTQIPMMKIVIGCLLGQGGPRISERCETSVSGLFAAGECPGNLYGAYRGNPFMDGILPTGRIAGKYAADYVKTIASGEIDLEIVGREKDRVYGFLKSKPNSLSPVELKKKIWEITGKHLFMIRSARGLRIAIREVEELRKKDLPRVQAVDIRRFNPDWVDAIESVFALDVMEMIARSALFREESRGCQYRDDFPEMDNENWLCHTLLWKDFGTGEMKLSKAPVVMTRYRPPARPGEEPIPI